MSFAGSMCHNNIHISWADTMASVDPICIHWNDGKEYVKHYATRKQTESLLIAILLINASSIDMINILWNRIRKTNK